MRKVLYGFLLFLALDPAVEAQNADEGFNWCDDKKTTQSLWTYLSDEVKKETIGAYKTARQPLNKLVKICPQVNKGLYIYGKKVYTELADDAMKNNPESDKVAVYQDSALYFFDKRLELFGDDPDFDKAAWLNKKGLYLFRYKRKSTKTVGGWKAIYEEYKRIHEVAGEDIYPYNANILFALSCDQKKRGELGDEDILKLYNNLEAYYDTHTAKGNKYGKVWKKYKKHIDQTLDGCVQFDCELVNNVLKPKYEETQEFALAKRMWTIMRDDGCTDEAFFKELTELIAEQEPNAALLSYTASMKVKDGDYDAAIEYYQKALEMEDDPEEKGDIMLKVAGLYQKKGAKSTARNWFKKAGAQGKTEAYNYIGNMYMAAGNDCKAGDPVKSRLVYIAAYNMYKRAGRTNKMEQAKQQFPSKTNIFTYSETYQEGQSYNTGCWVNETVKLMHR